MCNLCEKKQGEGNVVVVTDYKLSRSQQYDVVPKKANALWSCTVLTNHRIQIMGSNSPAPFCLGQTPLVSHFGHKF